MSELPAQFITDRRSPLRKVLDASRGGRAVEIIEFDGCDMHHRLLAAYDKVHRLHLQQSAKA